MLYSVRTTLLGIPSRLRGMINRRRVIALTIIAAFVLVAAANAIVRSGDPAETETPTRSVTVRQAGALAGAGAQLVTTGEVKSQAEGDLRAKQAGLITSVSVGVGDRVAAGRIIATIENATERASVAQAQASLSQAQASLNKVAGGTRDEQLAVLEANTESAREALAEARVSAANTLLSAYAATDSALSGGVDAMFTDPDGPNPSLAFDSTRGAQANEVEHERFLLQSVVERHAEADAAVNTLAADALITEIATVEEELLRIKGFLDTLITVVDGAIETAEVSATTISTYESTATAARTNILSARSSLSTSRGALRSAQSAYTVALQKQQEGVTGAQQEDIDVAAAQVEQAQASLAQAYARLENTYIRTPVTGTVTTLSIAAGDFVTSYQEVGLVANESTLEVVTFVAPEAATRLRVGGTATVANTYDAVITSIAPGLDPVTKQIEVRVALSDTDVTLAHGTRTEVAFATAVADTDQQADTPLLVPISALKLTGAGAFVFSVADGVLVAHEVTLGDVIGTSVEIEGGITALTTIVTDARGLNEGDDVVIRSDGALETEE